MQTNDTVRVLKLINHDDQFARMVNQSAIEPLIITRFDLSSPEEIERLSDLIFTEASGAEFIARCNCGEIEGNNKLGMYCRICDSHVHQANLLDDDNLVCRNWLECPKEIPNGWLSPKLYLNLTNWLSYAKKKRNYLDDILDVTVETPFELRELFPGKGFVYLHDNFDRIIEYFAHNHPQISKKPETTAMLECIALNRDKIFCHYIPILNAAISPIVTPDSGGQNKRRFTDPTSDHVMRAAVSLSGLQFSTRKTNRQYQIEKTTFKAFKDVIQYVEEATRTYVSIKPAIPRTHIFGSRFHCSFRGVVTPIIGPHQYYEIHPPWKMAVNTLRPHILGRLCSAYGMGVNEAGTKHSNALVMIDEDIKKIMNDFIAESPFPGIPCLWHRPPSIRDGSVMVKFWTKIKDDIEDSSVCVTPIDAALPNMDFDGDELAGILLMETDMVRGFSNLMPERLVFSKNTGEVSPEIGINKTLSIPWNSWLGNI